MSGSPRRPPDCVVVVARHHWLLSAVIFCFVAGVFALTRSWPRIEFGRQSYLIAFGLGFLYLAAGTMVWFGTPAGRLFNYVCSVLYLARPALGLRILRISDSAEFKAHFKRDKSISNPEAGKP
jgi:hypothetical protein